MPLGALAEVSGLTEDELLQLVDFGALAPVPPAVCAMISSSSPTVWRCFLRISTASASSRRSCAPCRPDCRDESARPCCRRARRLARAELGEVTDCPA